MSACFLFFHVHDACVNACTRQGPSRCLQRCHLNRVSSPPPWRAAPDRPALTGMVISQVDSGHSLTDGACVAVWRLRQTARAAPNAPRSHEDDHIWYTDDILSPLRQHRLIFPLWHPSLCGCYSSQIYHFNGEVVRPEDYLRDKYITVLLFGIDRTSLCPRLTLSRQMS